MLYAEAEMESRSALMRTRAADTSADTSTSLFTGWMGWERWEDWEEWEEWSERWSEFAMDRVGNVVVGDVVGDGDTGVRDDDGTSWRLGGGW